MRDKRIFLCIKYIGEDMIISHRGYIKKYPENSYEGIFYAFNQSYIDGVEFDVRVTLDNKFVIIHDATTSRTSNKSGYINKKTYKELLGYDFNGTKIPLLSDILKINSNNELYDEYGFYNGIVLDNISKKLIEPTEYSKERVEGILSFYDNKKNNASWGKANVVFILSEAFSDINNVSEVKFNKEIMPNINRYKNENDKMVMDLIVPSYGGASVNTEFEVLTGSSLNFFKAGFIPYTQYYNEYFHAESSLDLL